MIRDMRRRKRSKWRGRIAVNVLEKIAQRIVARPQGQREVGKLVDTAHQVNRGL